MTSTTAPAIKKEIVVDAPIDEAFHVFTDRFGDFKPPEHNLLGALETKQGFVRWKETQPGEPKTAGVTKKN